MLPAYLRLPFEARMQKAERQREQYDDVIMKRASLANFNGSAADMENTLKEMKMQMAEARRR